MNINRKPFRHPARMASHQYRTFRIAAPMTTHFRWASCEEFACVAFHNGWSYRKDALINENLLYAVTHAGKRYREMELPADDGVATYLVFEPGQKCFQESQHRIPLDRPEFYYAGRGDYRTFSHRKAQVFTRPADWVDAFANHQDQLRTAFERG